jgi:hypothetical protein
MTCFPRSPASSPCLGSSRRGLRHPQLLDPFGNWQIIGLALLAILFWAEMQDGQSATKGAYYTVSRE